MTRGRRRGCEVRCSPQKVPTSVMNCGAGGGAGRGASGGVGAARPEGAVD